MREDGNGTRREMQGQLGAVCHFIMSQGCKKFQTIDDGLTVACSDHPVDSVNVLTDVLDDEPCPYGC
jgi:hypothetical protein